MDKRTLTSLLYEGGARIGAGEPVDGARRNTLAKLAAWTAEADKVPVF